LRRASRVVAPPGRSGGVPALLRTVPPKTPHVAPFRSAKDDDGGTDCDTSRSRFGEDGANDDVAEALATDAADYPFDISRLPWAPRCRASRGPVGWTRIMAGSPRHAPRPRAVLLA